MSNFLILYPTVTLSYGDCIKICIQLLFPIQMHWYLADLCLDNMYVTLRCHIYNLEFVYENIGCQSFRTQVISYLLWSFRTYFLVISYPVTTISYPGHFLPILVISYLVQLGTKLLYGGQFVPKSFRTLFGHFVCILVIWCMDGWMEGCMDWWMDWRTDGRVLIEMTN